MSDLLKLAERCEAATGPEYVIDSAIWDAIYPGERDARFAKMNEKGPYAGRLGPADLDGYAPPLRAFTASLDAAMTLVPWEKLDARGFYFVLDRDYQSGRWIARFDQAGDECGHGETYIAEGNTAALALCAAALRARGEFQEADARLIAAAPTLLEALEAVEAAMLRGGDGAVGDFGWNITKLNKARPLIRAAINAATGGQQ